MFANIESLIGQTLTQIDGMDKNSEAITFVAEGGRSWIMHHIQDCCETVSVEDVCGDVSDLLGSPIVRADMPRSLDGFDANANPDGVDSHTWTFVVLGTAKGTVTIRWYGSSNGYYGETPWFEEAQS